MKTVVGSKRERNIFMLRCMCGFDKMVHSANVNGIACLLVICLLTQSKVKFFLWSDEGVWGC